MTYVWTLEYLLGIHPECKSHEGTNQSWPPVDPAEATEGDLDTCLSPPPEDSKFLQGH